MKISDVGTEIGSALMGNGGDYMDDDELILLIGIGLAALLTLLITLIICL